jgi:uncharacterized protein (DUF427 family)
MKAVWNNIIIADSDETIELEANHYFPPDSIYEEFFVESEKTSKCHWKGLAKYYSIHVGNAINLNAAWYYPSPKEEVNHIKNYIAFWKGIQIIES